MSRKWLCAAAIACLFAVSSCSTYRRPPRIIIDPGPKPASVGEGAQVFKITPEGEPSGRFEVLLVRNGSAQVLQSVSFDRMSGRGKLAVRTSRTGMDISLDAKCASSTHTGRKVLFPSSAVYCGAASSTEGAEAGGQATWVWLQVRAIGKRPRNFGWSSGDLDEVIRGSKSQPALRYYILTLKIDSQP